MSFYAPHMPNRGRPRLTPELLRARVQEYCSRYAVTADPGGMPPFPSGRRETRQHRAWLALYKAHDRLRRRGHGQCERCGAPTTEGSVFCEEHRAGEVPTGGATEASAVLAAQDGRCVACAEPLVLDEAVAFRGTVGSRLLHRRCRQLVRLARALGPEALERVRGLLWPSARIPRAPRRS
jgi:hypothetical protein